MTSTGRRRIAAIVWAALASVTESRAQGSAAQQPPAPTLRATWTRVAPRVDGYLNDVVWRTADVASNFTQRVPAGGAAGTERTEVRIAYDARALYVGVRNWDRAPDSIAQQLGRRDADDLYSDWFFIALDSYGDRRTAFVFGASPRGVLRDSYVSNDSDEDLSWDAVWNVVARTDSAGWTAEFRIPFSQLRYDVRGTAGAVRDWGLNFARDIARRGEEALWSPTPASAPGFVSRFGTLTGLDSLRAAARIELFPYVRTQLEAQPLGNQNRFVPAQRASVAAGGDVRLKLPRSLTLTASLNPDFGQVEADPAIVNLSAFEQFFEERRPFFLENADGFAFGRTRTFNDSDPPRFFYTRRIGRAPQRTPGGDDVTAINVPSRTPIAGALKLSGTTPSGWQIGLLNAVTPQEYADVLRAGDRESRERVEPLTNYHVARVRRLLRGGNTGIGTFVSDTRRALGDSLLSDRLARSSTVAGLDWEHAWQQRTWTVSGVYSRSAVRAAPAVLSRLERANYRSFQRPDAAHLALDSTRPSLGGSFSALSFAKTAGDRLLASVTFEQTSPGFEVNDLGFQTKSDVRSVSTSTQYRNPTQSRYAREWSTSLFTTLSENFGGDRTEARVGWFGETTLHNFLELRSFGSRSFETLNDRLLRGGPLARRPAASYQQVGFSTDGRRAFVLSVEGNVSGDASGARGRGASFETDWRPLPRVRLRIAPSWQSGESTDQFVRAVRDSLATSTFGQRYVFANVRQRELRLDTRVDWTFSPWLSLQLFLQPFTSSGAYSRYKEFTTPRRFEFAEYGVDRGTVAATSNGLTVDPDGTGRASPFSLDAEDFTYRALRGNAVLRWEYRPGSSVFLVWSQQREQSFDTAQFDVARQLGRAYGDPGTHVFLLKFSRWIGR